MPSGMHRTAVFIGGGELWAERAGPVYYRHLTLPAQCSVWMSGVAGYFKTNKVAGERLKGEYQ